MVYLRTDAPSILLRIFCIKEIKQVKEAVGCKKLDFKMELQKHLSIVNFLQINNT